MLRRFQVLQVYAWNGGHDLLIGGITVEYWAHKP